MAIDWVKLQEKWIDKWREHSVFEPEIEKRNKYFVTFPYPYLNGFLHIGHLYTWMRVESMARFKRHQGYNVLFPQAWHATGTPLITTAKRVEEKEPKQMKIMKELGFSDKEISKFADPSEWLRYFPAQAKTDLTNMGMSIDWRREFITTNLNPHYDKFIRWQFNTLKKKGYVTKGKHPVVWDPKLNIPIGDHDRVEGEGETPQEFTLLKFLFENDEYIVAATLRPETVYGQTNLWIGADLEYVKVSVNDEVWIMSENCANKLSLQDKKVKVIGKVKGKDLLGKKVTAPGVEREIIILPSYFCDPTKGTGIVTSVPSDAPDDWMGLHDLQKNKSECEKYGLNWETIKSIKPIPIIDSSDLGDMAAIKVCEDMKIQSQKDRQKLEEAKKIVYKKGYYEGTMNYNCGQYSGMKVEDAKELVKEELIKNGDADRMYELTGKVVSRSLSECVVKIVDDQWFIKYGDKEWKEKTKGAFKNIKLFPEKSRGQFEYTVDWLKDWACSREVGLGTRLPWDEKWLIESLSDSTIYMAYYTICHLLKNVDVNKIDDAFFDYVLLGDTNVKIRVDKEIADEMKSQFDYWYPLDFRNSGKDLVQNHLTFFIFNHVAIFPEDKWPRGIGVNGWVTVDGQKMSKSLGNMIPLRKMSTEYGSDTSRLTILSGGEGLDDPNWDSNFAIMVRNKLEQLYSFCVENYNKGSSSKRRIDLWLESQLNEIIRDTTHFMEETLYRSASQRGFFDLQRVVKWYIRRCGNKPNKDLMNKVIETQLILLAPFTPFVCEEIWSIIGKQSFISVEPWPSVDEDNIVENIEDEEKLVENVIEDVRNVMKLVNVKAKKVTLFVPEQWKYDLYSMLNDEIDFSAKVEMKEIISKAMTNNEVKTHGEEVAKIVGKVIKSRVLPKFVDRESEFTVLSEARDFLENEFGVDVEIIYGENSKEQKAKQGLPGKPAILIG